MRNENIEWRPVETDRIPKGLYEVSEYGDVWSVRSGKVMSPGHARDGYMRVCLTYNRKQNLTAISKLVALAFIGDPPEDMENPTIDHKDSDVKNNHYSNLRWMEHGENSATRKDKGFGEMNSHVKLSESDVVYIYKLIDDGVLNCEQIGKAYNITGTAVRNIRNGKSWKHLYEKMGRAG